MFGTGANLSKITFVHLLLLLLFFIILRSNVKNRCRNALSHIFSAARKITIKRGLTDVKTTERETASFEVELSHPHVTGTWTRNGIQLKPTSHFRMSAKGAVHSLTISNLSVEDTATFMFCVEHLKTSARLVVKGGSFREILPMFQQAETNAMQNSIILCSQN